MIPFYNRLIFPVQIQNHFHSQPDYVGHIVNAHNLPVMFCNTVLYLFLIFFKIF